jgi:hypothetical protein
MLIPVVLGKLWIAPLVAESKPKPFFYTGFYGLPSEKLAISVNRYLLDILRQQTTKLFNLTNDFKVGYRLATPLGSAQILPRLGQKT